MSTQRIQAIIKVLKPLNTYSPKTANAVKRFQSIYGLTADGIYGPKTKVKLEILMK
ncbi:hypothetical protein CWD84_12290 [Bacillus siamensis]|uniref:Peptidoglycan binding-like domain-containing protein n=1 Tax=Bacillus siamensis TaxID=659243 RepID=A0AAI8N0I5_9BACI|nr:hypothetical protein CWD84_12290 [Bacillus siamensis]